MRRARGFQTPEDQLPDRRSCLQQVGQQPPRARGPFGQRRRKSASAPAPRRRGARSGAHRRAGHAAGGRRPWAVPRSRGSVANARNLRVSAADVASRAAGRRDRWRLTGRGNEAEGHGREEECADCGHGCWLSSCYTSLVPEESETTHHPQRPARGFCNAVILGVFVVHDDTQLGPFLDFGPF